jgi:hypothetical protein
MARSVRIPGLSTRHTAWVFGMLAGCVGAVGEPGWSDVTEPPPPPEPGVMGSTPIHRLTRVELANTLGDLFGPDAVALIPPGTDPEVQGFDSNSAVLTFSETSIDSMMRLAENVAERFADGALEPCAGGSSERDCASAQIAAIAPRILRRSLPADERAELMMLWDDVQTREGGTVATRAVVQRLLMSPDFLYHVEIGDASGRLTAEELASRLSYLVWETMPDDALFDAARSGRLDTPEGVAMELERMLADDRASAAMLRFFEQWVDLAALENTVKDEAVYPGFDALRGPMRDEFRAFVGDLVRNDGTIEELFTSRRTYGDEALAAFYGVTPSGAGAQPIDLPADRAGFLSQGAFLAVHGKANKSSPILRGVFILDRLLCAPPAPPPPGVIAMVGEPPVTTTTRALVESLTAPSQCAVCHAEINPIGFAFEGFDGVGRARTEENGVTVDTTGELTAGDAAGPVSGAVELAEALGRSRDARVCLSTQWFRSRFRRSEHEGDLALIERVTDAVAADSDRVRAIATALAAEEALYLVHYREAR